jgi:hypothetical protein
MHINEKKKKKKQMLLNKENYKFKLQLKLKIYLEAKRENSKKLLIKGINNRDRDRGGRGDRSGGRSSGSGAIRGLSRILFRSKYSYSNG